MMASDIADALKVITGVGGSVTIIWKVAGWMRDVQSSLNAVKKEVLPNGGSSMSDRVNRNSEVVSNILPALERIEESTLRTEAVIRARDLASPWPVFEADTNGNFKWVNPALSALLGLGPDQVQGKGWLRGVHPEDANRVNVEWYDACADVRDFGEFFRLQNVQTGEVTRVYCRAHQLKVRDKLIGFVGMLELTNEGD